MDLASITLTLAGQTWKVPIFKPGDHERLDALLGLTEPGEDVPPPDHEAFPNRLTEDVNAALAAAGLGFKLRAEAVGNKLRLLANRFGGGHEVQGDSDRRQPARLCAAQEEASTTADGKLILTADLDVDGNGRIQAERRRLQCQHQNDGGSGDRCGRSHER